MAAHQILVGTSKGGKMIIAEIGQNWVGDRLLAQDLIAEAKDCGCDLAKFQLYDSVKLYGKKQEQEVELEDARFLFDYGEMLGIEVFFSVFDVERVKWCEEIGVKRYKIATIRKDRNVRKAIEATGKPVIESTDRRWIPSTDGHWQYLYCIPKYPAELKDLELSKINFKIFSGLSDHTLGIEAAIIALSRGAQIVEKHFRVEYNPSNPDYIHSITPKEMKELVRFSKKIEEAL